MASLLYLKHAYKLSDEELVQRWAENVVWQHFSGMRFYEPRLPCDATQIGRFRSAIGEAGVEELLKATIDTAVASQAIKPAEFERLIPPQLRDAPDSQAVPQLRRRRECEAFFSSPGRWRSRLAALG